MGKKKRKQAHPSRPMTRKQRSRAEREERANRWIIGGAIALGVAIVGILVFGFLSEVVIKGREPVAVVNGTPILTADFAARVRLRRTAIRQEQDGYRQQLALLAPDSPLVEQIRQIISERETQLQPEYAVILGSQVLDEMIQEEIIRQEAAQQNIAVSEEEIEHAVQQQFGYDPAAEAEDLLPPTDSPTATVPTTPTSLTREEYEESYRNYVNRVLEPSGVSEEDFRGLIEVSLLYNLVREVIVTSVPETMDQVNIRFITSSSQDEIDQIIERLDAGETWEDIVAEIEASEEPTTFSSEPGWQTETVISDQLGAEIAQTVFEASVGAYTQPLLGSTSSYYIIQVLAHEEHELEPLVLSYEQNIVFEDWFTQQRQFVEYGDWEEKVPTGP